jgi:hypothetical protein
MPTNVTPDQRAKIFSTVKDEGISITEAAESFLRAGSAFAEK